MARAGGELTARELEVLRLVAWNNKGIAAILGIKPHTVKNMLTQINRKLLGSPGRSGRKTRPRLLWVALCRGLVKVDEVSLGPIRF